MLAHYTDTAPTFPTAKRCRRASGRRAGGTLASSFRQNNLPGRPSKPRGSDISSGDQGQKDDKIGVPGGGGGGGKGGRSGGRARPALGMHLFPFSFDLYIFPCHLSSAVWGSPTMTTGVSDEDGKREICRVTPLFCIGSSAAATMALRAARRRINITNIPPQL